MALTTPKHALPYPEDNDDPDIPRDIKNLAMKVDDELDTVLGKAGVVIPGGHLYGPAPTATSNFIIQAGSTVIDATDGAGYFRITWPQPFPHTLLSVVMVSGDNSPLGVPLIFAPHYATWGFGDLTDTEWASYRADTGAPTPNLQIRVNWIAIGF